MKAWMGPAVGLPSLPQACVLRLWFVLDRLMAPSSGQLRLVVFNLDKQLMLESLPRGANGRVLPQRILLKIYLFTFLV
jgi:hypothetical protein